MDQATRRALLELLERDAIRLCSRFGLRYRVLEAERANVKRRYGVCYSDGTIRIRLRHASTGKALKYSSLVNTLCHELAHLRHFNHGPQFQAFYAKILECARREGIYRPRPPGSSEVARDRREAPRIAGASLPVPLPASFPALRPEPSARLAAMRTAPTSASTRPDPSRRASPAPSRPGVEQLELFTSPIRSG